MKYPYITIWKNDKYCEIFHNNYEKDKCESLKNILGKDLTFKIKYASIKFVEEKNSCKNNLEEIEKELKLK